MRIQTLLQTLVVTGLVFGSGTFGADTIRSIGANPQSGSSQAVVVEHKGLVHTAQLFPRDEQEKILADKNASSQATRLLEQLASTVKAAGGDSDKIVKVNVYVADSLAYQAVEAALAKRFSQDHKPAVSYVVTRLPHQGCQVAMDAVAVSSSPAKQVALHTASGAWDSHASMVPPGSLIYVSGQAEKGATLAEATRSTLESLKKTLRFLGRDLSDVVQVKSFFSPMSSIAEAQQEMSAFFVDKPVPPAVWVEWTAPLIEIELIAWGGPKGSGSTVEFLTPPGMNASPVYSRVARTNSQRLIYLSGLYARQSADGAGEVTDLFEQIGSILQQAGSDLQHLAKATYYCSNNESSTKLNELRPKYYHPARPPAASKAMVNGVGKEGRALTIDQIAVPKD